MRYGLFFSALLGSVAGFWLGLLAGVVLGLREKYYIIPFALFVSSIASYGFMFVFKKISKKASENIMFVFILALAFVSVYLFFSTLLRITR